MASSVLTDTMLDMIDSQAGKGNQKRLPLRLEFKFEGMTENAETETKRSSETLRDYRLVEAILRYPRRKSRYDARDELCDSQETQKKRRLENRRITSCNHCIQDSAG